MLPATWTAANSAASANEKREADEQLLGHQPAEHPHVERELLAVARVHGDRRDADGERDRDDAARPGRHHRGGEQRRQQEQRRHAREHEEESHDVLLAELGDKRARGSSAPTSAGIWP